MTNSPEPQLLDHRDINRDLAVFTTDAAVGSGLPLWLPAGAAIRRELEQLAAEIARDDGCSGVYSPVLAKRALFETSGHWDKFQPGHVSAHADRRGGTRAATRELSSPRHHLRGAAAFLS